MTPWNTHREDWKGCTLCGLCETRTRVVLYRGKLPCHVLFVGEAPGASEDVRGVPFDGPAGRLLDDVVRKALCGSGVKTGFTNLVGCMPPGGGPPESGSIEACSPRLQEIYRMAAPVMLVTVGDLAERWVPTMLNLSRVRAVATIAHPAAILRADVTRRSLMIRQSVNTVRDVWTACLESIQRG